MCTCYGYGPIIAMDLLFGHFFGNWTQERIGAMGCSLAFQINQTTPFGVRPTGP